MKTILGIDVGQAKLDVALVRDKQPIEHAQFDNSPRGLNQLWRFLRKRKATTLHACMEATGRYYETAAHFFYDHDAEVSVINPAQIKAYGRSQLSRNKTDKLDAALIADFCQSQQPPLWTPPDPSWYELQALVRHLADLQGDRQRQKNRLHALKNGAQASTTVQQRLQQQIAFLSQQIEQVKRDIQQHINQYPDLKHKRDLMASIKGIGILTAAKLLAEFRPLDDFKSIKQMVAFAGLNPRHRQSGTSVRGKTHISKMGGSALRAALYMPAIVAKNHNPILKAYAQGLAARGISKMEIIVAVMRKLLHQVFGILRSGQPFDPHYLQKEPLIA